MKKLLLMVLMLCGIGLGQTLPQGPRTFDTSFRLPVTGKVTNVPPGADLQAVFDAARPGDRIYLDSTGVWTGNYKLPAIQPGAWIYVMSNKVHKLPEGVRVGAGVARYMPKIKAKSDGYRLGALFTYKNASNWRFAGIEFIAEGSTYNLIQTGYTAPRYTDHLSTWKPVVNETDVPTNIIFDRCYIHSTLNVPPPAFARTGVMLNGHYMAVVDSEVSNFKELGGGEGHGIEIWQGAGPYKVKNNYIVASGIGMLVGGTDPKIVNGVPSDIEVTGNYFWKDPAWGSGVSNTWTIKNAFELKNAQRVLFQDNLIENIRFNSNGHRATAIVLTVRNQGGTAPWSVVRDVTIRNNRVSHCAIGLRLTGTDDLQTSQQTQRILVENNAWDDLSELYYERPSGFNVSSVKSLPAVDVTVRHNLFLHSGAGNTLTFLSAPAGTGTKAAQNLVIENNIFTLADYGVFGNGIGSGTVALDAYVVGYRWTRNLAINRAVDNTYERLKTAFATEYPADNVLVDGIEGVGFVDAPLGDYRLFQGSTYSLWASDGRDPGPDWQLLNAAANRARNGR